MSEPQSLAARAVRAVARAADAPLLEAGFRSADDGWYRQSGELFPVVRVVASKRSQPNWSAIGIALEVVWARDHEDRFGPGSLPASPVDEAAQRFVEARLWDLVPGRPRGGAWTVTPDSALDAVAADVVACLIRYGLPYLDEMTRDPSELPDVVRRWQARGIFSPQVDWRERKARTLWLLGDRERAAALVSGSRSSVPV